ncbi:hypothetical protein POV26_05990 [Aequorivita todarodis]|uniref:hypothetical protein n=1 Tax=Aequorivita todarodis TaxID=2036821 RepID=UPI002351031C|nr:hypothetical protein [Aequorivita todarodis]MDC8000578.1 hypothetical protein [Aequorivita todarodis]
MKNQIQISSKSRIALDSILVCAVFLALVYIGYQSVEIMYSQLTGQIASEMNRWAAGPIISR